MTPRRRVLVLILGASTVYYFSNPNHHSPYDYTSRIAYAMLHGRLGTHRQPPSWLNEMIPWQGWFYSAFPLGAVLCMIPVALLRIAGLVRNFPSAAIVALLSGAAVFFFSEIASRRGEKLWRCTMLALFPLFATWTWCDVPFGGAWHIALGFALLGEAGALYFSLVNRRPVFAGLFFAVAFGNRTEIILAAPL